jgi:hypothetical protein
VNGDYQLSRIPFIKSNTDWSPCLIHPPFPTFDIEEVEKEWHHIKCDVEGFKTGNFQPQDLQDRLLVFRL